MSSNKIGTTHRFEIEQDTNQRLDKFVSELLPELTRSRTQAMIAEGLVILNGEIPKKTGIQICAGDVVEVTIPPIKSTDVVAQDIPLDVLFENEDVLVINKAAGMVVHPAAGHEDGTLVNAILGYDTELDGIGGEERPGIVHRLDKDTSGVIIVAKNESALRWLQEQFSSRLAKKTYFALVDGKPATPKGRIEAPIGRDGTDRKKMAITSLRKGREAVSEYSTLESFPEHTLLEFHPYTGRTHQIRLHCAFLGCPIVGDNVYGKRKPTVEIGRHFLHAKKLEITLPNAESPSVFEAPLPKELTRILDGLRGRLVIPKGGGR